MLENWLKIFLKYKIWLLFIMLLNTIFGILIWLIGTSAFFSLFPAMLLGSLLLYGAMGFLLNGIDAKRKWEIRNYLETPWESGTEGIDKHFSKDDRELILEIGELLSKKEKSVRKLECEMEDYKKYVEAWAHEIKTPMALMTFVLDNRREEISPAAHTRLEYVRMKIQEDVERMLYYARLNTAGMDLFLKPLSLDTVCQEVIEEYHILLKDKNIKVVTEWEEISVVSDCKGLRFIISQVISNSIKYRCPDADAYIRFTSAKDTQGLESRLTISDNGIGVKSYDLPFLFEKGFTGEVGEQRKNSTGMGLYLAKQMADLLHIRLETAEDCERGLTMILSFPDVKVS